MPRFLLGVIAGQETIFDSWYRVIGNENPHLSISFIVLLTIDRGADIWFRNGNCY